MDKRKISVLHIITHLDVGGAQDNTILTCENLDKSLYDVWLVAAFEGRWISRVNRMNGVHLVNIPSLKREINPFKDLKSFFQLLKLLSRHHFTIIHTHSSKPGFIGRVTAALTGKSFIIHTIHGFPFNDFMPRIKRSLYVWIEKLLGSVTDYLITVSKLNLEKAENLKIYPKRKFVNIYSGIDFKKYLSNNDHDLAKNIREQLELGPECKLIGAVGRLSIQKDPLTLISAMPKILSAVPDAHVLLVGDGELADDCRQLAYQLNVQSNLHFLGFRDDIPALLKVLDLFVLTSRWEGLGRALTEAILLKIPVVVTKVEGVPELVENHVTGRLVEPANPDQFAQAVIEVFANYRLHKAMAEKAFTYVWDNFSVEKMVGDIEHLYAEAIASKNI